MKPLALMLCLSACATAHDWPLVSNAYRQDVCAETDNFTACMDAEQARLRANPQEILP